MHLLNSRRVERSPVYFELGIIFKMQLKDLQVEPLLYLLNYMHIMRASDKLKIISKDTECRNTWSEKLENAQQTSNSSPK